MKQTRKGKNRHFGMKLPIGTDKRGIVHTMTATDAGAADITRLPKLLHGREREVFGDRADWKEAERRAFEARKGGGRYRINRRLTSQRPLSWRRRMINRAFSDTRARGEHPLRVLKQLWGFAKVRYRGVAGSLCRAQTVFALAILYQVRRQLLLPAGGELRLVSGSGGKNRPCRLLRETNHPSPTPFFSRSSSLPCQLAVALRPVHSFPG